jgi:hypothetical protein
MLQPLYQYIDIVFASVRFGAARHKPERQFLLRGAGLR